MGFENYEREIIAGCLADQQTLVRASGSGLDHTKFSNPMYSWIYDQIIQYFRKYNKKPSHKVLGMMVDESSFDNKVKLAYIEALAAIKEVDTSAADYTIDRMTVYSKRQDFLSILQESAQIVSDSENLNEAYTKIFGHVVRESQSEKYRISDFFVRWKERKIERLSWKDRPRGITTGFPKIDQATDGFKPGELWGYMAKTGFGKSISLINLGAHFLEGNEHGRLLHIVTENPLDQVEARYDSRFHHFEYRRMRKWDVSEEEEIQMDARMLRLSNGSESRFRLVKCPPQLTNTMVIWEILTVLEFEGFVPDLIIVDSLEHIVPVAKVREHRLRCAYPFWEMKGLLVDKELRGTTSCQAKQEANGKRLRVTDMSEAYEKDRVLDGLIGMERDDDESNLQEVGFGRYRILKNRDGSPWGVDSIFFDGQRMLITPVTNDYDEIYGRREDGDSEA